MSNLLSDLHPCFRPIAQAILADAQHDISDGLIRPSVTFRSLADQAAAKAAGLSQLSIGFHQFGLAMDVVFINANGQYVSDGADPRYAAFGRAVIAHGCTWGGQWTHPDWDHCQIAGFTVAQYMAWLDAHKVATA